MPDWSPGKQNGKPVDVYYAIPIEFSLKSATSDLKPQFPGGEQEMMKFISENIKYPENAKEKGVTGTVIINFVVGSDGKIGRIKVMRGIGSGCDEEAIRVLVKMPNWIPGKKGGEAVAASVTLPFKFNLNSSDGKTGEIQVLPQAIGGEKPYVVVEQMPQEAERQIVDGQQAFVVVEQMPQFPGGENAMREFIQKTLKYPEEAKKNKVEGTVIVNFVIDKEGMIRNPRIMRGKPELNDEALRVINSMPAWIPGKQGGKPVLVSYTIPVKFTLPATETAAQQITDKPVPYSNVEEKPQFPGGEYEMMKFIKNNLKYPVIAQEEGATGTALVRFIINSSGKIVEAGVINEIHPSLIAEAIRLIRKMPDWIPGKQEGKATGVACTIPFKFILQFNNQKSLDNPPKVEGDFPEIIVVGFGISKATALETVKE